MTPNTHGCDYCAKALTQICGLYNARCPGCMARSIAGSQECMTAMTGGRESPVKATIRRVCVGLGINPDQAFSDQVKAWYGVGK